MKLGSLLIHGGILIDDLTFSGGRALEGLLGGAALYALAGAALWNDDVLLIGGIGQDGDNIILPWMRLNHLSTVGLRIAGKFTPRNTLVYRSDGSRTETPVFGFDHFARLQPGVDELVSRLPDARGAYIFRNTDLSFWTPVLRAVHTYSITLLWEISSESCFPENRADIATVCRGIAGLSLNLEEAVGIFGNHARQQLIEDVRGLGASVTFLRCGAEGSIVIWAREASVVPAYPTSVVDVTGAGNAYGGGALAGLIAGADPVRASHMGAIAACFAVRQHGLFLPRDVTIRSDAGTFLGDPPS